MSLFFANHIIPAFVYYHSYHGGGFGSMIVNTIVHGLIYGLIFNIMRALGLGGSIILTVVVVGAIWAAVRYYQKRGSSF